jgi:Pvc16 N-terminal domain
MLDTALGFFKDELNTYLVTQVGTAAAKVEVSTIVGEDGKYAISLGAIGATIINIEEERVFKAQVPEHNYTNGQHLVLEPELKLNLHLMFAAHFKQYDQALKYLSHLLTYFQSRPLFTSATYPGLDIRIQRLAVELQSPSYEQLNQIWGFIGGKQLPAVIYKVRMVSLQEMIPVMVQPPIGEINMNLHSR